MSRTQVVDAFYLDVRCMVLEIAAILDRYDRATVQLGDAATDPRWEQCSNALARLSLPYGEANRAEEIALVFSDAGVDRSA
jgi:hypothetical protein